MPEVNRIVREGISKLLKQMNPERLDRWLANTTPQTCLTRLQI
jgi:hypothetical protein